jgi:large subunit ribosomal protein L25
LIEEAEVSIVVQCEKRQETGKNACRRLRRRGLIPAVVYGEGMEALPLVVDKKDIIRILKLETGENTIFKIAVDKDKFDAMIKELQVDPASDELLHADLVRIALDKPIKVTVPVEHTGTPVGVKTEGGFIDFMTREVEVECLPRDIPESITVDITDLHLHQALKVENVRAPEGVRIVTSPETVLVMISAASKAEEFPGETPEAEVEEAKEPEVIKKGKAEEAEAEEEEK